MTNTAPDANLKPIVVGDLVKVTVKRRTHAGRIGFVTAIHGSVSGDTLITIDHEFQVYSRQVAVTT